MLTSATASNTHGSQHAVQRHALFAFEALRDGPIFTLVRDSGLKITEEVDWVHTLPSIRLRIGRPAHEPRLLIGLNAAAILGLANTSLTPCPGNPGAYSLRWERRR